MNCLRGLVVLLTLGLTGSALAEVEVYAGFGIGMSDAGAKAGDVESALTSQGYTVTGVSVDSEDSGWRFLTGLRFTDIFAVELGYIDLGEVKTDVVGDIPTTQTAQFAQDVAEALPVMPRGMTLAGVARFTLAQLGGASGPMAEKLSFAVKMGVIDADSERDAGGVRGRDEVNASPYYGLIFGWDFSDNWRGVAGYEVFNLDDSTDFWSAGVEFKFPTNK